MTPLRSEAAMAEGDLTQRITRHYQGDFEKLKDNTNNAQNKLVTILNNIRDAANQVASGSWRLRLVIMISATGRNSKQAP